MKFEFYQSMKQTFGDLQKQVSRALVEFLASGKDFEIVFDFIKHSKTYLQLRGIHRICRLYALRLTLNEWSSVSEDTAKEHLKYEFGIVQLANYDEAFREALVLKRKKALLGQKMTLVELNNLISNLQRTLLVPKSFANCTKEEMSKLLEKVREDFVVNRGWQEMELLPEELRDINEYFNLTTKGEQNEL